MKIKVYPGLFCSADVGDFLRIMKYPILLSKLAQSRDLAILIVADNKIKHFVAER